ncbi:MAG: enoyl-CoA hydratase/isomerase family protein, partial [Candidatus Eremiobacteraeota bacterium]|nr:enoyl-CoA hydratase/isomerase family protein [Candidatus Eremiobacteraeota bacterium]
MDDRRAGKGSLRLERAGALLRVTLDRPSRANALNAEIVDGLLAALDDAAAIVDLRVLVIEGNGANFCGGFDLSEIDAIDEAALIVRILRVETLLQRIYHAPFVTIACAQGNAVGAGADLFAACTYRIADPGARFRMPGWQFGIALGTKRLCDRIGAAAARDRLGTSRTLVAAEALHHRLATDVVERAA